MKTEIIVEERRITLLPEITYRKTFLGETDVDITYKTQIHILWLGFYTTPFSFTLTYWKE